MRTKFEPMVMDDWHAQPAGCALEMYFGSFGTGIDRATRQRAEEFLERDPAVAKVRPYLRGREGETLLCIHVGDDAEIGRLFGALKALSLASSDGRVVGIRAKGGLRFERRTH